MAKLVTGRLQYLNRCTCGLVIHYAVSEMLAVFLYVVMVHLSVSLDLCLRLQKVVRSHLLSSLSMQQDAFFNQAVVISN